MGPGWPFSPAHTVWMKLHYKSSWGPGRGLEALGSGQPHARPRRVSLRVAGKEAFLLEALLEHLVAPELPSVGNSRKMGSCLESNAEARNCQASEFVRLCGMACFWEGSREDRRLGPSGKL